jgi:hypothetical protein
MSPPCWPTEAGRKGLQACQERELLVQLTPENPVVKSVRERISSKKKIRQQLEDENPGLALVKTGQVPSQAPEK